MVRETGMTRRMRMFRAGYGLTQAEAAGLFNVSLTTWSRWERGEGIPLRAYQWLAAAMENMARLFDDAASQGLVNVRIEEQLARTASERGDTRSV